MRGLQCNVDARCNKPWIFTRGATAKFCCGSTIGPLNSIGITRISGLSPQSKITLNRTTPNHATPFDLHHTKTCNTYNFIPSTHTLYTTHLTTPCHPDKTSTQTLIPELMYLSPTSHNHPTLAIYAHVDEPQMWGTTRHKDC